MSQDRLYIHNPYSTTSLTSSDNGDKFAASLLIGAVSLVVGIFIPIALIGVALGAAGAIATKSKAQDEGVSVAVPRQRESATIDNSRELYELKSQLEANKRQHNSDIKALEKDKAELQQRLDKGLKDLQEQKRSLQTKTQQLSEQIQQRQQYEASQSKRVTQMERQLDLGLEEVNRQKSISQQKERAQLEQQRVQFQRETNLAAALASTQESSRQLEMILDQRDADIMREREDNAALASQLEQARHDNHTLAGSLTQERQQYEELLSELESDRDRALTRAKRTSDELESAQEVLSRMRAELESVYGDNDRLRAQLRHTMALNQSLEQEIKELQEKLSSEELSRSEYQLLERALGDAKEKLAVSMEREEAMQQRLEDASNAAQRDRATIEKLEKDNSDSTQQAEEQRQAFNGALDRQQRELVAANDTIARQRVREQISQGVIGSLEEEMFGLRSSNTDLTVKLAKEQVKNTRLKRALEEARDTVNKELKPVLEKFQAELSAAKASFESAEKSANEQSIQLNQQIRQLQDALEKKETQFSEASDSIEQKQRENEALESSAQALKELVHAAESKKASIEQQCVQSIRTIKALEAKAAIGDKVNASSAIELQALREQVLKFEQASHVQNEQLREASEVLEHYRQERDNLSEHSDSQKALLTEMAAENQKLKADLVRETQRLKDDLEKEKQRHKDEIEQKLMGVVTWDDFMESDRGYSDAEIQRLNGKVIELEQLRSDLELRIQQLEDNPVVITEARSDADAYRQLALDFDELTQEKARLEEQLSCEQEEAIKKENQQVIRDVAAGGKNYQLRQVIKETTAALNEANKAIKTARKEYRELEISHECLTDKFSRVEKESQSWKEKSEGHVKARVDANREKESIEYQLENAKELVEHFKSESLKVGRALSKRQSEYILLKADNDVLSSDRGELLLKQREEIKALQATVDKLRLELDIEKSCTKVYDQQLKEQDESNRELVARMLQPYLRDGVSREGQYILRIEDLLTKSIAIAVAEKERGYKAELTNQRQEDQKYYLGVMAKFEEEIKGLKQVIVELEDNAVEVPKGKVIKRSDSGETTLTNVSNSTGRTDGLSPISTADSLPISSGSSSPIGEAQQKTIKDDNGAYQSSTDLRNLVTPEKLDWRETVAATKGDGTPSLFN